MEAGRSSTVIHATAITPGLRYRISMGLALSQSTRRELPLPEQVELDGLQGCLDERFEWFDAGRPNAI